MDGNNHARAAIAAGHAILATTGHGPEREPWVPVGVGILTGRAYVGALGEPGKNVNIAVLGDNVNIAARLTEHAGQGTMVVSNASLQASGLSQEGFAFHSLSLKGKDAPMDTWVYQAL